MKKFQFRLARVLALRETQENQARMELGTIVRRILENENEERHLRRMALESRKQIDEELGNTHRVEQLSAHVTVVEQRIERNLEDRRRLEDERVRREEKYWESRKERRMLEIVRDRKKAEHTRELAAKEAVLFDAFHQYVMMQKREEGED